MTQTLFSFAFKEFPMPVQSYMPAARTLLCALLVSAPLSLFAVAPVSSDPLVRKDYIRKNCFEVVILKNETDSLTYEKPLDFEQQSYRVRTDKYLPIGTAFAIGRETLVTAAHVLDLTEKSLVYRQHFIRVRTSVNGTETESVYPVDRILAFSNNRDYCVFTAKGLALDDWLEIETSPEFNKTIYTAGNAYGEGIIIRDGVLLDQQPEPEKGEWNYLKSSIATNPGNSGGPLLNENLKVLGIVLSKKEDFCYSLAMKDIIDGKALLHWNTFFGFTVFNKRVKRVLDAELPLPASYDEVIDFASGTYEKLYVKSMDELFAENAAALFPSGEGSLKTLYSASTSIFPQAYIQNGNDNSWFVSKMQTQYSDLGNNGSIQWAETFKDSGIWFIEINRPDDIPASRFMDEPKLLMDTILKGISITRKIVSDDPGTRIVSNGSPSESTTHVDRYGRPWQINLWLMDFADKSVITFSTPTPSGVDIIYITCPSSSRKLWLYDLKRFCDFVNMSYDGTVDEWTAFFAKPENRFGGLAELTVESLKDEYVSVRNDEFSAVFDKVLLRISDTNDLIVTFSIFDRKGAPVWDIRRICLAEGGESKNYCLFFKWLKPDPRLPKDYQDDWRQNVFGRKHPYTGIPYSEDGKTAISAMHPDLFTSDGAATTGDYAWSLYLARAGVANTAVMDNLLRRFTANSEFR
jgi:hypothetical protein